MGGHKDHDNPAANVAPSPVDETGQATFWQGVFRLGQRWTRLMNGFPSDIRTQDPATLDQPLINRPHRELINPFINPLINHLDQPWSQSLLQIAVQDRN